MRLCAAGIARLRMWVLWFVLCTGMLCSADVLDCYCLLQPGLSRCAQLFYNIFLSWFQTYVLVSSSPLQAPCLAAGCCRESWRQEDNETDLRKSKLGIRKAEPSRAGASGEEVRTDKWADACPGLLVLTCLVIFHRHALISLVHVQEPRSDGDRLQLLLLSF